MDIWLQISLLLFFSIIGYLVSRRFKQPVSIGIIIAGIFIGPSVLGWVSYNDSIGILAQIGAIVLLFLVGLECDFKEIYTKKAFLVGSVGVVLPFIGGFIVSIIFGFDLITSLFVSAALTATSIGITAAVLKEMGKINTETAKLILGAAVIDDVLGLIVLSVVKAVPTGLGIDILFTIIKAIAFIAFAIIVGEKFVPRMVDRFDLRARDAKITFMLAMGIAFGYAFIAEWIGLSAVVGAFVAGISLSRSLNVRLFQSGAEYLEAIFTSIFFVSLGIIVNVNALFTSTFLIIVLVIVAIATKIIGCGYVAKKLGYSKKDSLIVGVGMVPRGEIALIIGLYGLLAGIITQEIYSALVFMAFITTLLTPPLLKMLYKNDSGKKTLQQNKPAAVKQGRKIKVRS
jgi:Kef-type K+ transport system membrane component KefB